MLPRPTQSRPARSARAWWACSGLPLWPRGWYPADSPALSSTRCCGRRGPPACLGDSPACVGHLGRVPGGLEGENPILEAAIGPSATGSGACGGSTVLGGHGEVRGILICIPGESRPCSYGSGAGRVPTARLAEAPFTRTPRRYARHRARSALRPDQGHGGHARSSPTQSACDGEPGSGRPPGGCVAAWDPNLQIYHDTLRARRQHGATCHDTSRSDRSVANDAGAHSTCSQRTSGHSSPTLCCPILGRARATAVAALVVEAPGACTVSQRAAAVCNRSSASSLTSRLAPPSYARLCRVAWAHVR